MSTMIKTEWEEIQYILDDIDWTEEQNDSGWYDLNRIIQLINK